MSNIDWRISIVVFMFLFGVFCVHRIMIIVQGISDQHKKNAIIMENIMESLRMIQSNTESKD